MAPVAGVAGLLLTGGASRRMGTDKAAIVVRGEPLAARLGRLLSRTVAPAIEVGPGRSGLPSVREPVPGQGPLPAIAAGRAELACLGHDGPALVLACDLPLVDEALLALLARWPRARRPVPKSAASAVPVAGGVAQVLCARWSAAALDAAGSLAAAGRRSVRELLDAAPVAWVAQAEWEEAAGAEAFFDIDTPADLAALGPAVGP